MRKKIRQLKQNDFIRHNTVFFVGSMAVAVANYLYYPVVGRLVSTAQFGEVQALISIFLQMALLFSIMADVTVNVVSNSTDSVKSDRLVIEFGRFTTFVMATVVIIALIFVQPLKHYLHFNNVFPFVLLGLALIISASSSLRAAYLRGKNAFGRLSLASLIGALAKLGASLGLVLMGFGTAGAICGLLVASVITWVYTRESARRLGLHTPKETQWWRLPDIGLIRPQLPFAGLVLIVSIVTTAFFSIDVILAKHYFSPTLAGEYAGIATVGRIIYFVTGSVAAVLLSAIQLQASRRHNRGLLLRSFALTVLLGGSVLIALAVAPRFFIGLLIGQRYLPLASLLPKLGLTLFLISIINLLFSYDVALRRWSVAFISVFGATVTVVFMLLNHATPSAMVNSLLAGAVLLLAVRAVGSLYRNWPWRRANRLSQNEQG